MARRDAGNVVQGERRPAVAGRATVMSRARCRLTAFRLTKFCKTSSVAAVARCAGGGGLTFGLTTASSRRQSRASAG
jgi:hypothetical protein